MSKVRNLPETTLLEENDLIYAIDVSEGPNAGRKATISTLKEAVIADSSEIPYDNTSSGLDAINVKDAIDESYERVLDHSLRHAPDAADGLAVAAPVTVNADGSNDIGVANFYSRSDHKHDILVAAPVSIGTANDSGLSSSLSRADHVHAHGVQTDPTLHAAATTSANGFMSSTDKTKLNSLVFGYLSYRNNAAQSTTQNNTAYTAIVLDTDNGSFANSLLTKSTTTQFRTDFTGYVKISVKIKAQNTSANDVAWRAAILQGGVAIAHTDMRANGKTNADRYNSLAGTFILPCTNGDLFSIGFSNAEAATTDTINIVASGASVSVHALYVTP